MLILSSYEFSTFFLGIIFWTKKRYDTTLMKLQITLSVKFCLNEDRGKFVLSLDKKIKLKSKRVKVKIWTLSQFGHKWSRQRLEMGTNVLVLEVNLAPVKAWASIESTKAGGHWAWSTFELARTGRFLSKLTDSVLLYVSSNTWSEYFVKNGSGKC